MIYDLIIKGSTDLVIDGLFVEIGAIPNVELAVSLGVELDERGYIKADSMMRTNVDGIFAAGDTVNHLNKISLCLNNSMQFKWKKLHPKGEVLSRETGATRFYGQDPYGDYYTKPGTFFPVDKKDDRLPDTELYK